MDEILCESAVVDNDAEKLYLHALENGVIDLGAFHKAYDALIDEPRIGLKDLFYDNGTGKLKSKSSYGIIKTIKNIYNPNPLYNALMSLWTAQFKDGLPTAKTTTSAAIDSATGGNEYDDERKKRLLMTAVETLNKAKGVDISLSNIKPMQAGAVSGGNHITFDMSWNGITRRWGFPGSWFDPNHTHTAVVADAVAAGKIPDTFSDDMKIIAKLMLYIWSPQVKAAFHVK